MSKSWREPKRQRSEADGRKDGRLDSYSRKKRRKSKVTVRDVGEYLRDYSDRGD